MKITMSLVCFCFAALLTACGGGDPYDTGAQKVKLVAEVSTYLGSGRVGTADGTGNQVEFSGPTGVVFDSNGNLFIADGSAIRKVTPDNAVTTIASAVPGGLFGIAIDGAGNIFTSSPFSHLIYKIPAFDQSQLIVFAGIAYNGGFLDASTGTAATFSFPKGLTADQAGNVYVADSGNNAIRKITSAGAVSTMAGNGAAGTADGNGTAATFNQPSGVALDTAGNIYVADTYYGLIRKISLSRTVTTLAGNATSGDSTDGKGDAARFVFPKGLTVDASGNIIVAETENHTIRKVTPDGVVTTLAGNGTGALKNGIGGLARFNYPTAITVDSKGVFYIADLSNYVIRSLKMIWM